MESSTCRISIILFKAGSGSSLMIWSQALPPEQPEINATLTTLSLAASGYSQTTMLVIQSSIK